MFLQLGHIAPIWYDGLFLVFKNPLFNETHVFRPGGWLRTERGLTTNTSGSWRAYRAGGEALVQKEIERSRSYQQALVDHRAGRLQQAEAAYRQILTIDPARADVHHALGNALHGLGRPEEAARAMAKLCGFGQISLKFTPTSAIRSAPSAGQQRRRRAIAKLCGFGQISLKLTATSAMRCAPSAGQQRRRRAIAKLCGFGQISLRRTATSAVR